MSIFDLAPASFIPKRSIGPFTANVTVEEVCTDELEITEHPVEQGASITDHAYVKPASIIIRAIFTEQISETTLVETYQNLLQLQSDAEPFDVVTGKRSYQNCLIKTLTETNDATTENILSVRFELQQVFIVALETSTVASPENQADPQSTQKIENTGEKSPQSVSDSKGQSILDAIVGGE